MQESGQSLKIGLKQNIFLVEFLQFIQRDGWCFFCQVWNALGKVPVDASYYSCNFLFVLILKDGASWWSVLLRDTGVTTLDPHSSEHQSLSSPVPRTTRPWHNKMKVTYYNYWKINRQGRSYVSFRKLGALQVRYCSLNSTENVIVEWWTDFIFKSTVNVW